MHLFKYSFQKSIYKIKRYQNCLYKKIIQTPIVKSFLVRWCICYGKIKDILSKIVWSKPNDFCSLNFYKHNLYISYYISYYQLFALLQTRFGENFVRHYQSCTEDNVSKDIYERVMIKYILYCVYQQIHNILSNAKNKSTCCSYDQEHHKSDLNVKSFLFIASTSKYFLSQIFFMQCHLKLKLAPLNFILSTIILQDKLIINTYLYTTGLLEIVFNINIHLPYIYNSKSNTGHHLKNNHIYINKQYRYNFV
ncbi:hypothetical protein AGLY_008055, partial [Aphis glycines]